MFARNGLRSSALARAQAHLSGQRVPIKPKDSADELQEYMHTLSKKTNALKNSQPSFADLSDLSVEEQQSKKLKATPKPQQAAESRFLKKKTSAFESPKTNVAITREVEKPVNLQAVQSKMPSSAALKRLADIENRHRLRKLELEISENDSDLRTSEERPFSNRSSSEFSVRDKRFLKKKVYIKEPELREQVAGYAARSKPMRRSLDSEDEEMHRLVGSSLELSENGDRWRRIPEPPRTPSPPSKSTPRRKLRHSPSAQGFISPRRPPSRLPSRTPSPPSHGTPRFPRRTHSLSRFGSRSPSPSIRSTLTSPSPRSRLGRRSRTSLSQRSDLKSLDELFSRADEISSASSNDFKLNILNLDELELPTNIEEPKMEQFVEKAKKMHQLTSTEDQNEISYKESKILPSNQLSTSEEDSASEVETETNKDSEIRKREGHSISSESYFQQQPDYDTAQSAYSEDFEGAVTEQDSDSYSLSSKEYSLPSSHSSAQASEPRGDNKQTEKVKRVTIKEKAVQTNDAGLSYYGLQESFGIGHTRTPIVMEPASMVNHVVNPDVIEALTTYSPLALALNDMIKQQLHLTQTFADLARQLHLSTVRSLESELYHYTTLEDTKEYIKQQKALLSHGLRQKVVG